MKSSGSEFQSRASQAIATNVDVLTLSATPIPRTLHMSLLGVRDISNLETAPEERLSVETKVIRFDEKAIRTAILRELNRGGQIYFVHNRIEDIEIVASKLQRIAPEAKMVIGHGRMNEHKLEQVMIDFIEHKYDLLLSTTIIESGLDIPNANTIFIDEADHYGLSELHQLRGRVGRYKNQAHCYLLVDRNKHLTADAARRLHAIEEYSQIGAGFGIAMRDLEIRGAGNLLGTQQSGHIAAVGYELYCQLLESAVRELTHLPPKRGIDVEFNLPIEGFIPVEYVPEMRHKIDLYRRLSRIDSIDQIADLRQEMLDRFGELPTVVSKLLEVAELRIDATLWQIQYIGIEDEFLLVEFADRHRIEQLAKRHRGKLRVLDQKQAFWPLPEKDVDYLSSFTRYCSHPLDRLCLRATGILCRSSRIMVDYDDRTSPVVRALILATLKTLCAIVFFKPGLVEPRCRRIATMSVAQEPEPQENSIGSVVFGTSANGRDPFATPLPNPNTNGQMQRASFQQPPCSSIRRHQLPTTLLEWPKCDLIAEPPTRRSMPRYRFKIFARDAC